jgi:hypothetical protein
VRCLPVTLQRHAAAGSQKEAFADPAQPAALRSLTPFNVTGRAGEEQDRQHQQRGDDKCEEECPEKAHAAVSAAEPGEHAERYVGDNFDHGAKSRRSAARRAWRAEPLPDWPAYCRASQELVAEAPVLEPGCEGLALDLLPLDSHSSFCALTKSR